MTSILLVMLVPRALAIDSVPNKSCSSPETIPSLTVGDGALSSSSDVDAYRISGLAEGTLRVMLLNRSNPDDDTLIELASGRRSTVLVSDAMSDGFAELSYAVTSSTDLCVRVSGSAGGYTLLTQFVATPPDVTDVHNLAGRHIPKASIGTSIDLIGTGFGTSTIDTTVTFNGARANVVSASGTSLRVRVPENASDGDIVVIRDSGASEGYRFNVGVPSPAADSFTVGDDAFYDEVDGVGLYLNRTIVAFDYDFDSTDIADALDDVMALDANRTAWTIVGEAPEFNMDQVEWTFSTYPTDVDLEALLYDLEVQPGITLVEAEVVGHEQDLAVPSDYDLFYRPATSAGLGQINFEEARRLHWLSGLPTAPAWVDVFVPDTGMYFGTATWNSSVDEFPEERFLLYELDASGFEITPAEGHDVYDIGGTGVRAAHGNAVVGVIAAANDRDPSWADGAARVGDNASGIWSSFDVFGIDDDGNAAIDEAGEWSPGQVIAIGVRGKAGDATGRITSDLLWRGMSWANAIHGATPIDSQVMSLSIGLRCPPSTWSTGASCPQSWKNIVREVCRVRPLLVAAGNEGTDDMEVIGYPAAILSEVCPDTSLVVSGVTAGVDADEPYGNFGPAVDILAPAENWFVASANGWPDGSWAPTYDLGEGTSLGTPAVASAYALLRGIIPKTGAGSWSDALVLRLLVLTADDISALYTLDGSKKRLNLFEAMWTALRIVGARPAMTLPPQIFVTDYADESIVAQEVDAETGEVLGTAFTINTHTAGCDGPTDVEVHPLGDVVYALCVDSSNIVAWATDTYAKIGEVPLEGVVDTYSEMAIAQDGILRVGTIDGGDSVIESFDTWNGTRFIEKETLGSAATGRVYGAAIRPKNGMDLAFGATDNVFREDDDALSVVTPDDLGHAASSIYLETFSSLTDTSILRDVSWYADGSSAVGVFYGSSASGGDQELGFSDGAGTVATATIDYCEEPVSIAMDRTDKSGFGYVACSGNYDVVEVDLSTLADSYSATTTMYMKASSGAAWDAYPVFVETPENSNFLVIGSYSYALASYTYVVPRSVATGGGSVYSGSYDAIGHTFDRLRGAAITPMLSFATPRPGTTISGIKRLHTIIRDPSIESIEYLVDGKTVCTDSELSDGSSEDCVLNTTSAAWPYGAHVVTAVAQIGGENQWSVNATYERW